MVLKYPLLEIKKEKTRFVRSFNYRNTRWWSNKMNPRYQKFNLKIVVQPAKEVRFRYAGDHTSSIVGENNTRPERTVPTITTDYRGKVRVFATLVDRNNRAHPHRLVGTNCADGICELELTITDANPNIEFSQIGIERAMKSDFINAMRTRQQHCFGDPFGCGYNPKTYDSINPHEVRLAFLAVVEEENVSPNRLIGPLASNIIRDSKASLQLKIVYSSECNGPVTGGSQLILLTDKVNGDKRVNVMFENRHNKWLVYANPTIMHKRVAFVATVPAYCDPGITESVFVLCSLIREQKQHAFDPSIDVSNSVTFEYYPGPRGDAVTKQGDKHINPTIAKMFNQHDLERIEATRAELNNEAESMSTEQSHHLEPNTATVPVEQPNHIGPYLLVSTPYQRPSTVQQSFVAPNQHPSTVQQSFVPPNRPTTVQQSFEPPYQNPSAVQAFVPPNQHPSTAQQKNVPPYQHPSTVQQTFVPLYQHPSTVQQTFVPPYQHPSTVQQEFVPPNQHPSTAQQKNVPPFQHPSTVQQTFVPLYQHPSTVQQSFVPPYQHPSTVQQSCVPPYQHPSTVQQSCVPPYQHPFTVQQAFVPPYQHPSTVQQAFVPPYQHPSTVQQTFVPPYQHPSTVQQSCVPPYQHPSTVQHLINQSYRVEPNSSPEPQHTEQCFITEPHPYSPAQNFENNIKPEAELLNLEQLLATEITLSTEGHPQETVEHHKYPQNPQPESIDDGVTLAQMSLSSLDLCDIDMLSGILNPENYVVN